MTHLGIIIGSTRPGRRGEAVARWAGDVAAQHAATRQADVTYEIVDLRDFGLPLLDEPVPAAVGGYRNPHTARWAEAVASFDGYIVVTPEYNHSVPAALKNAIDFLFEEWHDKAVGFVSYGVHGGTRAVEHLRLAFAEVKVAGVRSQVALSLFTDFQITDPAEPGVFAPGPHQEPALVAMLDEVVAWSRALRSLRAVPTAV